MKRLIIVASLLFVFGCQSDSGRIDGTNQQMFNETVDAVAKKLPVMQQDKFKEALDLLFEYRTSANLDDDGRWAVVRNLLDGKNVEEVFDLAEQVATENSISWNRNQVPFANGIPKRSDTAIIEEILNEPGSAISRFDFRVEQDAEGFYISPFFYGTDGKEIQLDQAITATIELFQGGDVIYTSRAKIDPNSMDALYRSNGIGVKYASLDPKKIKTDHIDILVRVPHPDKYLSNRKAITIPMDYVRGGGERQDSIVVSKEIAKETSMITTLSNRFLTNLSKKNYSGAFALTRSNDWSTYQKFSNDQLVQLLENAQVNDSRIVDADEKTTLVESSVTLADQSTKKYQLTLEKINNKWFVVQFKP